MSEEYKPINIFVPEVINFQGNTVFRSFQQKPNFGRYPTFEEDLLELRKRWYGKDEEVLVQHMIDSLIIFLHNQQNLQDGVKKLKRLDELKAIKPTI